MGFPNSMQSSTSPVIVAGSFTETAVVQAGDGFSVAVSTGNFTVTLDRQYDGVISIVATMFNGGLAAGESGYAVVKSHAVTADTDGGNFVINFIDDAGNIQTSFQSDIECHFIAVLSADT